MSDLALAAPRPPASLPARWAALAATEGFRRWRPAAIAVAVALVALLAWSVLSAPDWKPLYAELSDGDKAAVATALTAANFASRIDPVTGNVEVASGQVAAARILLAGQGLPKSATPLDVLGTMPLGMSRAVEAARLKTADEAALSASIAAIDGVKRAVVHVAAPEASVFIREQAPATASVFVTLAPGRVLGEAQVRAIVWLVSASVPGLSPDRISVVDQSGALLTGDGIGDQRQLGYQMRLEANIRQRVVKLLTPLIGAGRFTAEVAADVDFTSSDTTSERFDKNGAVLRSETASRAQDNNPPLARGIPGALSNTAPAAASLTTTPPVAPAAPAPAATPSSEATNRAWEIGRDVSVTRGTAPRVRRLSVAVVVDRPGTPKPNPAELAALARLVRGVVGFDASRGDVVEVDARAFAALPAEPLPGWWEVPPVSLLLPWAPALLVLPVGAAILLRRKRPAAAAAVLDGGVLQARPMAVDYARKLDDARLLVASDGDRAAATVRQMLAEPA